MARKISPSNSSHVAQKSNGANLGFEEKMWQAADKLRSHIDAAEYKHVVLGLVFLKYISDAFQERHQELELLTADQTRPVTISLKSQVRVMKYLKTVMNTGRKMSSGCLNRQDGRTFRLMPSSRPSAS